MIDNAFGFGGELFASVSDESGGDANNADDMPKWFHGLSVRRCCVGCQKFVKRIVKRL